MCCSCASTPMPSKRRPGRSRRRASTSGSDRVATESIRLVDVQPYWSRLREQLAGGWSTADAQPTPSRTVRPLRVLRVRRDLRGAVARRGLAHYVAGIRAPEIARRSKARTSARWPRLAERIESVPGAASRAARRAPTPGHAAASAAAGDRRRRAEVLGAPTPTQRDRACPSPTTATCSSTSRAIRSGAADDLFFLFGLLDRRRTARGVRGAVGPRPGRGARHGDRSDRLPRRAARGPSGHARLPLQPHRAVLARAAGRRARRRRAGAGGDGRERRVRRPARRRPQRDADRHRVVRLEARRAAHRLRAQPRDRRRAPAPSSSTSSGPRDRDPARLDRIARYNEDDVRATIAVRDWLRRDRRSTDATGATRRCCSPRTNATSTPLAATSDRYRGAVEDPAGAAARVLGPRGSSPSRPTPGPARRRPRPPPRRPRGHRRPHVRCATKSRPEGSGTRERSSASRPGAAPELVEGEDRLMFPAGPDGLVSVGNDGATTQRRRAHRGVGRARPPRSASFRPDDGAQRLGDDDGQVRRRSRRGDDPCRRRHRLPGDRRAPPPRDSRASLPARRCRPAIGSAPTRTRSSRRPPRWIAPCSPCRAHPAPARRTPGRMIVRRLVARRQARRHHGVQPQRDRQPAAASACSTTRRCGSSDRARKPMPARSRASRTTPAGRSGTRAAIRSRRRHELDVRQRRHADARRRSTS